MNVYQTDSNGVYVGTTTADKDPLDSTNWLIPAGCVETTPPTITDKQFAKWDGAKWSVETITVAEPEPEPDGKVVAIPVPPRAARDKLLKNSDWTQLNDAPVDKSAWATYRQALRDIPSQSGFPTNVTWPVEPT